MNNKSLLTYLLLGGAAYYFIYASKPKSKSYSITVPEPTKINEKEYRQKAPVKTIFQKASPVVKKIFKKKKSVGNFPYTF